MSMLSDDEQAIEELSQIAKVYLARGMTEKAEEILRLVEAIHRRLQKERRHASGMKLPRMLG
jgi:hypothetical protein